MQRHAVAATLASGRGAIVIRREETTGIDRLAPKRLGGVVHDGGVADDRNRQA
jgi:hypothetical protein